MDWAIWAEPATWISLATLSLMEIVLGIDNIVFITILCGKLPPSHEQRARRLGIGIALVSRLALLGALSWVMQLTQPLFTMPIWDKSFSGRDLILVFGGLFLIGKATHEIYENVEHPEVEGINDPGQESKGAEVSAEDVSSAMARIMVQVIILDIVFSLDSVITAVGMAQHLSVMVVAMVLAVVIMLIFAGPVGDFVQKNPSVRILALAFLVLIGVMLLVDGMGQHVSKGYIYSAIAFSLLVELVNLRRRKKEATLVGGG